MRCHVLCVMEASVQQPPLDDHWLLYDSRAIVRSCGTEHK